MNEFDFKSWYVLLAIFIAHIYRHYTTLEKIPVEMSTLKDAIESYNSRQGNINGVNNQVKKVRESLLNLDTIILHILALLVLIIILLLFFDIPQKYLTVEEFGPLALPFNLGEKIIYVLVALLFLLSYITKAIIPTIKALKHYCNAKKMIKDSIKK